MAGAVLLGSGIMAGSAEPGMPALSEFSLEPMENSLPLAGPTPIQLANAPGCVRADLDDAGGEDVLVVRNDCSFQVRLKVVLAYGPDLACRTYSPGDAWTFKWNYP
ncbi:MAG TPA: hypothetical protein VNM90_21840, partial [Haliangium sp.]|nr:hypothetical protein [Haliangium sp.]